MDIRAFGDDTIILACGKCKMLAEAQRCERKSHSRQHAYDPLNEPSTIVAANGVAPRQVTLQEQHLTAFQVPAGEGSDAPAQSRHDT
jgi:hypothetical protein